jgi:hypothetical protein
MAMMVVTEMTEETATAVALTATVVAMVTVAETAAAVDQSSPCRVLVSHRIKDHHWQQSCSPSPHSDW